MGQIIFSRNPIGPLSLALFLVGISAFAYSTVDPVFGPLAIVCIGAGAAVAIALALRRPKQLHVDPRELDRVEGAPPPIEPR